jgi:hypothetical protein
MATTQNYYKVKHGLEVPSQDTFQVTDNTGPSVRPSLTLDFAKTKTLDPRITFTRASTATYYDGKATAKAEENLFTNSNDPTSYLSTVQNVTKTTGATAPDGSTTAILLTETTANDSHRIFSTAPSANANTTYTLSLHAKTNGVRYVGIEFRFSTVNTVKYTFDVVSGNVARNDSITSTTSASISIAGNGWYRLSITGIASASGPIVVGFENTPGNVSYAGSTSNGCYLWGIQYEQRDRATAYTPTTTAAITNYIPVLQTAASGTARFDHDPVTSESKGLLIEEQRTNQALYSNNLSNPYWTTDNQGTLFENAAIAPNGTATANLLKESTLNSTHARFIKSSPWSTFNNIPFTFSLYVKSYGQKRNIFMLCQDSANAFYAHFDIVQGTVVQSAGNGSGTLSASRIESVGNSWFRISITGTINSTAIYTMIHLDAVGQTGFGAGIYQGDGSSGAYIWGPQFEAGEFQTSYIPTNLAYTGRGSTATFRGTNNLIQTAAANVARYEPNASGGSNILLESASSNLSIYTDHLNLASLGNGNPEVKQDFSIISPAGTPSFKITTTSTTNTYPCLVISGNGGVVTHGTAGSTLTLSWYAKKGTHLYTYGLVIDSGVFDGAFYNFDTGITTNAGNITSTMTSVGGGWYRCTMTRTLVASAAQFYIGTSPSTDFNYIPGFGFSYLWGAQLEVGSTATSHVPSIETHTGRSSTATYYDSTGIVRTAASDQPRYSYNPELLSAPPKLLLETQATNSFTYSEDFNTAWVKSITAVSVNTAVSPDGTQTADLLTPTSTTSSVCGVYQNRNGSTSGTRYCASVFAKASGKNFLMLGADNVVGFVGWFDLSNGTVGTMPTGYIGAIISVGNGWYRCSVTWDGSVGRDYPFVGLSDANGSALVTLSGSNGILVWGAQLEAGYTATSYIQTVASAVTRAADTSTSAVQTRAADVYSSAAVTRSVDAAGMTGINFSSWYNPTQGTLAVDCIYGPKAAVPANTSTPVCISDNTTANFIYTGASNQTQTTSYVNTNSVEMANLGNAITTVSGLLGKSAIGYQNNNFASSQNGAAVVTDLSGVVPQAVNQLWIGTVFPSYTLQIFNGTIKKVTYYPKRLSNAELANITSI